MNVGIAFGDHIKTEKIQRYKNDKRDGFSKRSYVLAICLVLVAFVVFFRLVQLQVVRGEYYRELADDNRTRTQIVFAPRGSILDRNGAPLVFNVPGYRKIDNEKTIFLGRDEALERIAKGEKNIQVDTLRNYPYQDSLSHVLGYVGQISEDQLKQAKYKDYSLSDIIGKSGVEEEYENVLRGIPGKTLIEVDAFGKAVRTLGQTDPVAGKDITLTIDGPLQKEVYEAMKGVDKGVAIVSTPDGEIMAMVSKPSFDPNLFTLGANYTATDSAYKTVDSILTDKTNQPLLNRAIGGTYPPGSTFKLVTAASGIESKKIDENYKVEDTGVVRIGPYSFSNWYFTQHGGKDGSVDVTKAISRSNDIFFYKLAEKIGVGQLAKTGEEFGLGKKLGIDLLGEEEGTLPTADWKKKVIGEPWYTGDTLIYGIGQGYLLTTPLQVNNWTATIANGGWVYKPHLLKSEDPKPISEDILGAASTSLIREGMIRSCARGGVAFPFFEFKVKNEKLKVDGRNILVAPLATTSANFKDYRHVVVACKTGTAQWGGEKDKPHAWITLFAPAYDPEIVVTVLAEASGEGSQVAAPIAKKIVESYFTTHQN